tara:strand:- start:80 stop:523 length:444 start_codon:yes stop_codon:yes gene_type:complete
MEDIMKINSMKILITTSILLLISACDNWDEQGVKMANEMPNYATEYINKNNILHKDEKIICYYDVTLSFDASESAILTNKRVVYHKNKTNFSIDYGDIEEIKYLEEFSDVIVVTDKEGGSIKIEIAPLNGGEIFYDVLKSKYDNFKK